MTVLPPNGQIEEIHAAKSLFQVASISFRLYSFTLQTMWVENKTLFILMHPKMTLENREYEI